jgi:hypothetical protein
LDLVYPVILIDAIVVKARSGQVRNRPVCGSPRATSPAASADVLSG